MWNEGLRLPIVMEAFVVQALVVQAFAETPSPSGKRIGMRGNDSP